MSEFELYHIDDRGQKVDLSDEQKELADKAKDRCAEKIKKDPEMTEDEYMAELYSKDHDEYLVNNAVLQCSMATPDFKLLRGKAYNVPSPDTTTFLNVTENPKAKCCGYLYHATVKDRKAGVNIPPFRCNCDREPHNEKEWSKLEKDESCLIEGTCKALINLCDEWDNLPTEKSYMMFWNEDRQGMVPGITMSSMLFCRHGGIITPVESGQIDDQYLLEPDINDPIQVQEYMWFFFLHKGFSHEATAGILGNVKRECEFNIPLAEKQNPNRFGLFQWSNNQDDNRTQEFIKWANTNGLDMELVSTQCEYAYHEMATSTWPIILDVNENNASELLCSYDTLLEAQTPAEAARIFATFFERCCTSYYIDSNKQIHYCDIQHSQDRQNNAAIVYIEMRGKMK